MPTIAGFTATGRKMIGPASDLYELEDAEGLKHTAIVFHEEWCAHSAITDALGVIQGYLESPLVTGLVELVGHFPAQGAFLYPTGKVWSVAEVVQALSDRGERGGIRAGLELMYTAGQILTEGAEAGEAQGVYSHGGLTPRRIVVKGDGQVMVVGYGLPQVEILEYHVDRQQVPREDSFRYCPPERLEARPEDVSSDLFGLSLIAFEVMTGKPVYDGLVNDIRQQAARGEGSRRLFRFREVLPEPVRNLLTKALRPDAGSRYLSGEDFLHDVHALLSDRNVPGPSLLDLMGEVQSDQRRVGGVMQQGRTQMVEADELRNQLEVEEEGIRESLGRSSSDVWSRANRKRIAPRGRNPAPVEPSEEKAPVLSAEPLKEAVPLPVEVSSQPEADDIPSPVWAKATRTPRRVRRVTEPEDLSVPESIGMDESDSVPLPPARERRVTRSTGGRESIPAPPVIPPPEVIESAPTTPTANDLLLQIRGQSGAGQSPNLSDQATAIFEKDQAVEVLLDSSDDADSATAMMTPDELRAKLAAELEEVPPQRKEDTPKGKARSDSMALRFFLPNGTEVEECFPSDLPAAAAVTTVVGRLVPFPLDQSGTLQAWFRFEQGGKRVDPRKSLDQIGADQLRLVEVSGDTRVVEVSVVSGGQDVRFNNPMSTVVPVYSLTTHLQKWLALPDADWEMVFAGEVLDPHMILADLSNTDSLSVQLRVAGS